MENNGEYSVDPTKDDVSFGRRVCNALKENILVELTLIGVIIGFVIGFAIRDEDISDEGLMWLGFPGDIFLNLLKLCIVPVIVSSIISATASMDMKGNAKICGIFMAFIVVTNLIIGSGLGVLFGLAIRLGDTEPDEQYTRTLTSDLKTSDIVADIIRNVFPPNLVQVTLQKAQTSYEVTKTDEVFQNITGNYTVQTEEKKRSVGFVNSVNIMGIIMGSVLFGVAASRLGQKAKPFVNFFESMMEVILLAMQWLMWTTPIGVMSLVAKSISQIDDLERTFSQLGAFVGAVTAGLLVQHLILYPLIYFAFVRANPFMMYLEIVKPWLAAFASTSDAVSMPYMYASCEELKYDKRVYKVGIPLNVTFAAPGSSLFICGAVQVLAIISGVDLGVAECIQVWLLVWVITLGLPSVPSASLVVVVVVCTTVDVPPEAVGLLFAVEWFLDRLRTASNMTCELTSIGVVDKLVRKDMEKLDREEQQMQSNTDRSVSEHTGSTHF